MRDLPFEFRVQGFGIRVQTSRNFKVLLFVCFGVWKFESFGFRSFGSRFYGPRLMYFSKTRGDGNLGTKIIIKGLMPVRDVPEGPKH